jgi:hypothetical protein
MIKSGNKKCLGPFTKNVVTKKQPKTCDFWFFVVAVCVPGLFFVFV